jgi:hypothetical protein
MDAASDWVASGKGALDFDGSNDFVDCGSSVPWFPNTHTMVMWVFFRGGNRPFRYYENGPTFYNLGNVWNIVFGGSFAWVPSPSVPIAFNKWQQVAYTRNGNDGAIYTDGVLRATTSSLTANYSNTSTVAIGVGYTTPPEYANTLGDDYCIYNTALTANEVAQIYRLGRGYGVFPEPDFDEGFAGAGFKAYWARRQSQLIGGGV